MPPPRAASADPLSPPQTATDLALAIEEFVATHGEASVLEDGKVAFDLRTARHSVSTEHDRCTLHLWSEERNLVRQVVAATPRGDALRLATAKLGQTGTKLLELVPTRERRTPTGRENRRTAYLRSLERVLARQFPEWKPDGFRTAMDLERSFGPAYARGTLVRGNTAWAVIGVGAHESAASVEGVLGIGILWLHTCREKGDGRRLYGGLKIIVPRGSATLTLSRLRWLNPAVAKWELYELDEHGEELTERDPADQGNLRTRLVHRPDAAAAAERFAPAVEAVRALVPDGEWERVDQHLRHAGELVFLLHGLEFARARLAFAPNSFAQTLDVTAGVGSSETLLEPASLPELRRQVSELFRRRRAFSAESAFDRRGLTSARRIGPVQPGPVHARLRAGLPGSGESGVPPARDPLYRAAPERWLESALVRDLAPLTRALGPVAAHWPAPSRKQTYANDPDPDTAGNRAEPPNRPADDADGNRRAGYGLPESRIIPRIDPQHVYTQVPAIAGAGDRGLLDLLGVTHDGRLAVIELKASDDLQFALQGLDYWIRVRHHHVEASHSVTGLGEFQLHGYFRGVELSAAAPRLYLVAPALHIHPATEILLRYFSPRVEWCLLALAERWREEIRVVWRRSGGIG